jgi:poly-gamma-glutamate synthesis protein (capsule biosynthesis protein)
MAGDILLHTRPVAAARTEEGYDFRPYFEEIAPYLEEGFAVCNMESPVDAFGGNAKLSSYPMFNVPYEILPALRDAGFDALVTANNHSYDKGLGGLIATRRNIDAAGLLHTGVNETQEQYDEYLIADVNGIQVGILAYSELDNGNSWNIPAENLPFAMRRFTLSEDSVPAMAQDMQNCRDAGAELIILSLHWGAEYQDRPNDAQVNLARLLAEQGADVVMGNHSHCVQPMEWVDTPRGERVIFYSLGNFFADQTALDPPRPKTQYGLLATVRAVKDGDTLTLSAETLATHSRRYPDENSPNGNGYRLEPAEPDSPAFAHVAKILGRVDSN